MKTPRLTLSIFAVVVSVAAGEVQPLEDAPSVLRLSSGAEIKVLDIFKTTLIETDEPALVLRYPTSKIKEALCSEAEEVWAAFQPTTTQNFRTGRHTGYPIFASGEDITEASLMKALASGDPNALDFGFQAGISADVLPQANQALNQATRQQVALIQAAQAGEPTAQAILAQRKAARGAELAANEQAHLAFLRQPYAGYMGDAP